MNSKFVLSILAGSMLALTGCGSSPRKLIVGRWEAEQSGVKISAEFKQDGKATLVMFGQPLQGTYKLNGSDQLEWNVNGRTTKGKIKVTGKSLEVTNDEGATIVYKRA
jgi:hypothetical protein